ncbi:MAG: A/G-specific adenine glycosylase, partial [Waddliaceae bacterium]
VSEVMLQQTRVSTVIPYFYRWMKRFPTVHHLGRASLDEVIKLWEGLGYYSRARNLFEGARYVLKNHDGKVPQSQEELAKIKGLGPYTIGAIRSFAFHHKAAAVDGNVLRVITRYMMIKNDIANTRTVQEIRKTLEELLPNEEPWIINEALIELGAMVCRKIPKCDECPLKKTCKSHINAVAKDLPIKTPPSKTKPLYRAVAIIFCGELLFVRRGQEGQIMHDLHEFPYFETTKQGLSSEELKTIISKKLSLKVTLIQPLDAVVHAFTRYRVLLSPMKFEAEKPTPVRGYKWLTLKELDKFAFSSGHRKIYRLIRG